MLVGQLCRLLRVLEVSLQVINLALKFVLDGQGCFLCLPSNLGRSLQLTGHGSFNFCERCLALCHGRFALGNRLRVATLCGGKRRFDLLQMALDLLQVRLDLHQVLLGALALRSLLSNLKLSLLELLLLRQGCFRRSIRALLVRRLKLAHLPCKIVRCCECSFDLSQVVLRSFKLKLGLLERLLVCQSSFRRGIGVHFVRRLEFPQLALKFLCQASCFLKSSELCHFELCTHPSCRGLKILLRARQDSVVLVVCHLQCSVSILLGCAMLLNQAAALQLCSLLNLSDLHFHHLGLTLD